MKLGFKIAWILSTAWYLYWQVTLIQSFGMSDDYVQRLSLLVNIKLVTAIALYIAWRVTPDKGQ